MSCAFIQGLVGIFAAFVSLAPSSAHAGDPAGTVTTPEFAELARRWREVMPEFLVAGMSVVAVRDGQVAYLECFGERNLEQKTPVTPDTAFYIASCTKPFTAMGVMQLADAGKLDLEAPVRKYLPRFELADADLAQKCTVRDLLCHRTGIHSQPIVVLDAYTGEITDDRYYHFLRSARSRGACEYSNVHYTLLGRVIEAASGQTWQDYLLKHVLQAAGMKHATPYADELYARPDVAVPYAHDGEKLAPAQQRKTNATMHAAGGLAASARDMAQWLLLNTNEGEVDGRRVLSPARLREMGALECAGQARGRIRVEKGFGLGWGVGTYRGRPMLKHGGGYPGAAAHVYVLPEQRIGVAILASGPEPAALFIDQVVSIHLIDKLLGESHPDLLPRLLEEVHKRLPELKERWAKKSAPFADAELSLPRERYTGTYTNPHWGTLKVESENGLLRARLGSLARTAAPAGRDAFTLPDDEDAAGRFVVEGDKVAAVELTLDGEAVRFERQ